MENHKNLMQYSDSSMNYKKKCFMKFASGANFIKLFPHNLQPEIQLTRLLCFNALFLHQRNGLKIS